MTSQAAGRYCKVRPDPTGTRQSVGVSLILKSGVRRIEVNAGRSDDEYGLWWVNRDKTWGANPLPGWAPRKGGAMLYYALVFFVVALVAGLLGFGAVAFAAAGIARILFFIFLVLFLVSMIGHLGRGQRI
jgi:uncharacterized membrane protein YtjA (UPF0391 family)